jgi:hypothetical protein
MAYITYLGDMDPWWQREGVMLMVRRGRKSQICPLK